LSTLTHMQPRDYQKLGDRVFRVPRGEPWRIPLTLVKVPKFRSLSLTVLVWGFACIIGLGAFLLWLPISSKTGQFTPLSDVLFTATSATCVTGLVVVDTGTYWSTFGQGVILALIQVGGFGFMTSATLLLLTLGQRVGLRERFLMKESMGLQLGGLVPLIVGMGVFTIVLESLGTAIYFIKFSGELPSGTAAWQALFLSVSAFNNAGFDIFGNNFRSLADYQGDPLITLTTAALVILGGISFMVVMDVIRTRSFKKFSLDTKLVLTTVGSLLAVGMVVFLITEYNNPDTLGPMSGPQKVLVAFFQSVTPRTAGFAVIGVGRLAVYTLFFTIMLMFVGGASGSTAGGIKVNTFSVLLATVWSTLRGREHPGAFGREFKHQQISRALTVALLSLGIVAVVVLIMTVTEEVEFIDALFETVSAFGTVGLTTGITPLLSEAGKLIITITMFAGRLGPLTLALSLVQAQQPSAYRFPQDQVRIG